MPTNPHLVRKRTKDPGTAQMMQDVYKRLRKVEGHGTSISNGSATYANGVSLPPSPTGATAPSSGAIITAPSITTASGQNGNLPTNPMIVIQGDGGYYTSESAGIYCIDSSGIVSLYIKPDLGLVLNSRTSEINDISWYNSSTLEGFISVAPSSGGSLMTVAAAGGDSTMSIDIGCYSTEDAAVAVYSDGALTALLSDAYGNATFNGNVIIGVGLEVTEGMTVANDVVVINSAGEVSVNSSGYVASYYLYFNTASGDEITANYNTPSDVSLKSNIEPLESKGVIASLKPVTYVSKKTGETHTGFVAQDIDGVIPNATHTFTLANDKTEYMSYEMSAIVAHLVAEVQTLQGRLDVAERGIANG